MTAADAVRRASVQRLPEIGDRLDDAVRGVDLQVARIPVWAGVVRVLQWILVVAALLGAAWTVATALSGTLDDTPVRFGVALPLILLLGGVGLGVLLALVCRGLVAGTARRRAAVADTRLREAVGVVTHDLVVSPVEIELEAYTRARGGLSKALATR